MVNNRFFHSEEMTLKELQDKLHFEVIGSCDLVIKKVATLKTAVCGDLSFFSNRKYKEDFKNTKASVCIVSEEFVPIAPEGITLIVVDDPYETYAKIANIMYGNKAKPTGVSDRAVINPTAKIGKDCYIKSGVFIGKNVELGNNCHVGANVYIADNVVIGANTTIYNNSSIKCAVIGEGVTIHAGVRIGQDGFGYAGMSLTKVPQLGGVRIGNMVEVGANTTIDRGAVEDTVIGDNTKIDNLVQIGHGAVIGRSCVLVAQVGVAGSTVLGDGVIVGGQSGVAGHLNIESGVKIAARSGVIADVKQGNVVGGYPAVNIMDWHRMTSFLKRTIKKKSK